MGRPPFSQAAIAQHRACVSLRRVARRGVGVARRRCPATRFMGTVVGAAQRMSAATAAPRAAVTIICCGGLDVTRSHCARNGERRTSRRGGGRRSGASIQPSARLVFRGRRLVNTRVYQGPRNHFSVNMCEIITSFLSLVPQVHDTTPEVMAPCIFGTRDQGLSQRSIIPLLLRELDDSNGGLNKVRRS